MIQETIQRVYGLGWRQSRLFQDQLIRTLVFGLLILGSLTYLTPLGWMISTALKSEQQVYLIDSGWLPDPVVWENFSTAVTSFPFLLYFRNSLITSILPVIGTLLSSTLVAYAFSRLKFPGRDLLFMLVLSTLMLPFQVLLIPVYVIWAKLGAVNTFVPLILPSFFGSAFNIFLIRQFFRGIPHDLSDAAIIDGCSHFGILWRIMIPLSKPVLATVAIFHFMGHWNDLLGPVLYLNREALYTLMIGLTYFRTETNTSWQLLMAASLLVLAPSVVIFFFGQKYFVQGITLTGLKG
jgi:ABC-type glycerol-3-phosphate transport system permease component